MDKSALLYCLVTVLAWGGASVLDKVLVGPSGLSPWTAVLLRLVAGTIIVSAYAAHAGALGEVRGMSAMEPSRLWMLVAAFAGSALLGSLVGQVSYYHALQHADASRVVPITSTYPLVGALLAIGFLGEKLTLVKVVGAACIVLGIVLLSGALNARSN